MRFRYKYIYVYELHKTITSYLVFSAIRIINLLLLLLLIAHYEYRD